MKHSFETEIAMKYGIAQAVILDNIYFWIKKNEANEKHIHDGRAWTYNTTSAFQILFPYLSKDKIGRILRELETEELIMSGNFNEHAYDRTKWYALTDKGMTLMQNCNFHYANLQNGTCRIAQPIPYIKPYINTNMSENSDESEKFSILTEKDERGFTIEDRFNHLWKKYPKNPKGNKKASMKAYKDYVTKGKMYLGKRYKFTEIQIGNAINKYIKERQDAGTELQYYKNFDTLMNNIAEYVEGE